MSLEKILKSFKAIARRTITTGLISSVFLLSCAKDSSSPISPDNPEPPQNRPPVITSSPPTQVNENNSYAYYVSAYDPDGDVMNYRMLEGPNWLSVVSNSLVGRAPEVSQNTNYSVKIRVSDLREGVGYVGGTDDQAWNLSVRNVSNTRVLPEAQLAQISNIDNNSITFSQPIEFSQNDIIVAGISNATPNGFLREVTSVSGNRKTIQTTQATFEQAVETNSFSFSEELSPQSPNSAEFIKGAGTNEIAESDDFKFNISLGNVILFDLDGNESTTEDQLIANGNISFNTRTNFYISIRNHTLDELSFRNSTDIESEVTLGSNIIGIAQRRQIKIAEYNFHPFVAGYIPTPVPIPVVILPKLGVYVGIDPTNVNPLSVRVKQDANSQTGLIYKDRNWSTTSDFSNDFDFSNPVVSRDLELKVFAGPSLEFMIYGIAGPFGSLSGRLRLNHNNNSWQLYGGYGASLGARMEVFKRGVSLQFREIINYERLLTQGERGGALDSLAIQLGPEGKDAYVSHIAWPDGSHGYSREGDTTLLEIKKMFPSYYGSESEALIEFPLFEIPGNADIFSAKLMVYGYGVSNFGDSPSIKLSKSRNFWSESSVTWNTRPPKTIIRSIEFVPEGENSWHEFDVTSDVRAWVSGEENYGFNLSVGVGDNEVSAKIYSGDNPDTQKRPILKIYYH